MQKIFFTIALIVAFSNLKCQIITDTVYNPQIHTIQLIKESWELGYPIIELGGTDKFIIGFDELTDRMKTYCYTIEHCTGNWELSGLSFTQYADGFEQNQINDYAFSTNTVVGYVHYKFELPNESCTFKVSGNYILKVFENFDPEKIVFTKRFYVYETLVSINAKVIEPVIPYLIKKGQQVDIDLVHDFENLRDPINDFKVLVSQNFCMGNAHKWIKPIYIDDKKISYTDPDVNYFDGLKEFRNFDIKSIKYQSVKIQEMKFTGNWYDIFLYADEVLYKKPYAYEEDLNGKYYIENSIGRRKDIDADYVNVWFKLPYPEPVIDGNLYIFGALSNYTCTKYNKLNYNFNNRAFEVQMLLKQGYYNYQYMYIDNTGKWDATFIEGSSYQTENDYHIFVYYQYPEERFQRLVGYAVVNSRNK